MCNFLTKLGGVVASQENAAHLFDQEALVGLLISLKAIRGTFTPYKRTHKLRDFAQRSEFACTRGAESEGADYSLGCCWPRGRSFQSSAESILSRVVKELRKALFTDRACVPTCPDSASFEVA